MTLEQIIANLPPNMHPVDKLHYLQAQEELIEIEVSNTNKHYIETLLNRAHEIMKPYVLDSNYKGLSNPNNITFDHIEQQIINLINRHAKFILYHESKIFSKRK